MQDALLRRGPDDRGAWSDGIASLVHTRLSIIDLGGSRQPMLNRDESVVVSYNGEIYNYRKLRSELLLRGHEFHSRGDTEVILRLYEQYGRESIAKLDGMFAIGIYDARRRTLLLARDRAGVKPLYYWHSERTGELVFASDLKTLMANSVVPRRLNRKALAQFLHFGYVVHPESWLEGVRQVEPGQIVECRDGELRLHTYYQWTHVPANELGDHRRATEHLRETLAECVDSHLVSDVPVGTFLSGGLDSATVTGFAQHARQGERAAVDSFNVRFSASEFDESSRASAIARDLGTKHKQIDTETLPFSRSFTDEFVAALGEPFGDTSALAVYGLCSAAREQVKVALSGDGGDELFLGYTGLRRQKLARRIRAIPAALRMAGQRWALPTNSDLPRRIGKYLGLSMLDDAGIVIEWSRRWPWQDMEALLGPGTIREMYPDRRELFPEVRSRIMRTTTRDFAELQSRFHLLVDLPCDCLFKVDRMSMAHGLEVRVPMLGNAMLAFASELPMGAREVRKRTKEPLRTVAEQLAPTLLQPYPKHGFRFPLQQWLRGKLQTSWREWEITRALAAAGFCNAYLEQMVEFSSDDQAAPGSYAASAVSSRLFDLLLLGVWTQNYKISVN